MGYREDFKKTINFQEPEHCVIDFGGNPLSRMEGRSMEYLLEYLGFTPGREDMTRFGYNSPMDERIMEKFHIGVRSVGKILVPESKLARTISDTENIDEWGIRRKFTGQYWDIVESPLRDADLTDVRNYPWPDGDTISEEELKLFEHRAKDIYENSDYVICAEHPVYGVFELGCWMFGFDDFLMKMILEPEIVKEFFEIILDYQKKVIKKYYGKIGPYIHYTSSGDDFATQTSTFVSREMFRQQVAPFLKERIDYTKKHTDAAYLHHSCGNVFSIIDILIECGVDILNPIQPAAAEMMPSNLKKTYGKSIVFHGGVDTQQLLPYGTKEEIREAVGTIMRQMRGNGGYIFACAHNIQEDVPPENIVYMLEAADEYGRF